MQTTTYIPQSQALIIATDRSAAQSQVSRKPYRVNGKFAKRPATPSNDSQPIIMSGDASDPSISAEEFTELRSEVADLSGKVSNLMDQLTAMFGSTSSPPAPPAVNSTTPPPAQQTAQPPASSSLQPAPPGPTMAPATSAAFRGFSQSPSWGALGAQSQSSPFGTASGMQFVPPLPPLDSPAGAPSSLRSLFPDVEPAVLVLVISHELKAQDLYKLDGRVNEMEATFSLNANGIFERNVSGHKQYTSPATVIHPLHTYFAILTAHLASVPAVPAAVRTSAPTYFYRYLGHLTSLAAEYEWKAVLRYHELFFNRRRNDMIDGLYANWAYPDVGLLSMHVYQHRRTASPVTSGSGNKTAPAKRSPPPTANASEVCRNFNLGQCTSPCRFGRSHTCSSPGCGAIRRIRSCRSAPRVNLADLATVTSSHNVHHLDQSELSLPFA
ncbi:unnamed protein product [Mycena citricolor]|uniref:Uncharacterized protein n=1 Tax=Mycena citricolor TaxID=2018698 RepID=A0AAD2Q2H5_9AGAR|nr:unnamed protein product [Mycena citricolor]